MVTKIEIQKKILDNEQLVMQQNVELELLTESKLKNVKLADSAGKAAIISNDKFKVDLKLKADAAIANNLLIDKQIKLKQDGIKKLAEDITKLKKDLTLIVDTVEDKYYALSQKVNKLSDKIPLLLFPVRIELRFNQSGSICQLWVRVYPDTCQSEVDRNYMTIEESKSIVAYLADPVDRITEKHGNNRSAFLFSLIRKYKDIADFKTLLEKQDKAKVKTKFLVDLVEQKPVPYANTLPESFVFRLYNSTGSSYRTLVGNVIPSKVALGYNQEVNSDKGVEWMHNFNKAVEIGLGIKIDLTQAEYDAGFSKLLVYGIKSTNTVDTGKTQLENLFENHYYSNGGLAIVKQGTPTNNSDNEDSGHSWKENWDNTPDVAPNDAYKVTSDTLSSGFTMNDGDWVSQYLGINDAITQKLPNARGTDQKDARLMNSALFPATLGYFFEEMMEPVMAKSDINTAENFFVNYVLGRGTVPSVRIGKQPYGILPASVWSRFKPSTTDKGITVIATKVKELFGYWKNAIPQLKKIDNNATLSSEDFLSILALQPNSISFYQRIFDDITAKLNAANAGMTLLPLFTEDFVETFYAQSPDIKAKLVAAGLDPNTDRPEVIFKVFNETDTLLNGPLIEEVKDEFGMKLKEVFSETEVLSKNYIQWLATNNYDTVNSETGYNYGKKSLLYLLLRHALLLKYNETNVDLVAVAEGLSYDAVKLRQKDNQVIDATSRSKPAQMYKTNKKVTGSDILPVKDYIDKGVMDKVVPPGLNLISAYKNKFATLSGFTKATLERAFVEHLDCCSYRIDAWINGLYSYQLRKQRESGSAWTKGIFLGSYGYVENIRKASSVASNGYILAPSITHAATGALLKNAQISYNDSAANPYDINLSSERVALAKQMLEGIRNGLGMSELLGYKFERKLHDESLDKYIAGFRERFPAVVTANSEAGTVAGKAVNKANLVDGLKLLSEYDRAGANIYSDIDAITTPDENKMNLVFDYMLNISDSMKDIAIAEGVYQFLNSNFERGGANLDTISKGNYPLEPEVIKTPRKGTILTHKVGLHIKVVAASYPGSVRASLEPSVNDWLRKMLPSFETVVFTIKLNGLAQGKEKTLKDLKIEPIDLVYLLQPSDSKAMSVLDDLITGYVLQTEQNVKTLTIEYTTKKNVASFTLFELSAMVSNLRKILFQSKFISANDFVYNTGSIAQYPNMVTNEHVSQLKNAKTALSTLISGVTINESTVKATIDSIAAINTLLGRISSSASLGSVLEGFLSLKVAGKDKNSDEGAALYKELQELVAGIREGLNAKQTALNTLAGKYKANDSFEAFTADLKLALGDDTLLLPSFVITDNITEINDAYVNSDKLLDHSKTILKHDFPVIEWMGSVARVREKMFVLENTMMASETVGLTPLACKPMQFPYAPNDRWLAIQYAKKGEAFKVTDKMLYTFVCDPTVSISIKDKMCGLMIDEWTEEIPNAEETAGMSFHYNRPNAEAPQSILLVTPPEIKGTWAMEDIPDSINSTMELAKIRAVEPDHLSNTPLAQFIPATVMFANVYNSSITLNLLQNVE